MTTPENAAAPAGTVGAVVRFPDSRGFWWMNDPHAYGWEVVRVRIRPTGETVIWRTGCIGPEEIQVWCTEWVKIDKPNTAATVSRYASTVRVQVGGTMQEETR